MVFAGQMDEGWTRLVQTTHRARELGAEAEAARGYRMIGSSASTLVEYDVAERWLVEGIEYADATEQWNHLSYMASHQAHVWWCQGRWDDADRSAERLLTEDDGGITTRITALHVAGFVAMGRGRLDTAMAVLDEARAAGEEMRELQRFSPALWGLAECALLRGDVSASVALTAARIPGVARCRGRCEPVPVPRHRDPRPAGAAGLPSQRRSGRTPVGDDLRRRRIPGTMPALDHAAGLIALAAGRTGKAREMLESAHAGWTSRSRWWEGQWCAVDLARCAIASNRRTEASTLVDGVRVSASALGAKPLLDAAAEVGSRLDEHDAAQPWSPLTLREFEVAKLVAGGLTNREIAEELRITVRTAGSHLEHIRAKLGASRRSEIATWVTLLETGGQIDA